MSARPQASTPPSPASPEMPLMPRAGAYQVLPPMSPEQFEALKTDIAERGVLTPIDVDEYGCILDGHHRLRACTELGISDYPVFVRVGLSEAEKRTYARQVNTLRRHITRAQLRDLIGGQLRDTPHWSDARIARALGTTDKTVRALRRRLEATSEIPRLTTFEGADGKTRPSTQPVRAIFAADGDDLAAVLARVAGLPPDQTIGQVTRFLSAHSLGVIVDESYDPFAGCSEAETRAWHLFVLFLVQQEGYSVDGAAGHVEWILQRHFSAVADWLGEAGGSWRRAVGLHELPATAVRAWTAFSAAHRDRTSPDLVSELRALNPQLRARP